MLSFYFHRSVWLFFVRAGWPLLSRPPPLTRTHPSKATSLLTRRHHTTWRLLTVTEGALHAHPYLCMDQYAETHGMLWIHVTQHGTIHILIHVLKRRASARRFAFLRISSKDGKKQVNVIANAVEQIEPPFISHQSKLRTDEKSWGLMTSLTFLLCVVLYCRNFKTED